MKTLFSAVGVLVILFIVSTTAFSANMVDIKFVGAYDKVVKSTSIGSLYAGLYNLKVNGKTWLTYCLDPFTTINSGAEWEAYFYPPGDIAAGKGKLFSYPSRVPQSVALQKYRMLGYLYSKYGGLDDKSQRANLNLTFWEIAKDYAGNPSDLDLTKGGFKVYSDYGNAANWLTEAYGYRDIGPFPYLYTPKPLTAGQEMFAIPEPGTLLLLGSGLLGFGIVNKLRRKKK